MRYTENGKLPLRDGALMNYDLYLPDAKEPCPAILMRTPYARGTLKMNASATMPAATRITATQTLFHDAAHPSCVLLPVLKE